ncbi:Alpha/Beta hydrolase protein [Dactylonectria macrodidyma]|uniref:Alpha/Beta hydrolase protein n=1 Tax=Dactylonectria macrodidyma TaxID=307937 RepID=A0A9P9E671_9HYPO|nr:Alpha/Beta hydrolase protein [Dactylonectria macrodidyma]
MSVPKCCLTGFKWDGEPVGCIDKLEGEDVYITGSNDKAAVLIVADLLGWSFPNVRLLADHYAEELDATVYVPDLFAGEVLPFDLLNAGRWGEIDIAGFMARNSRAIREPQIFACAKALRQKHPKLAAVGYCYGGWAIFRLGAREHQPPLVDAITTGHPSLLTPEDIDGVGVPVQVLAPEIDHVYTPALKLHTFQTLQSSGLPFDYQHFPGVEHACLVRGDEKKDGERAAMVRGKDAAVAWIKQFIRDE